MFYLWDWQRLLWCRPTWVRNTHVTRAQLGQLPVSKSLPVSMSLTSPRPTSTRCQPQAPDVIRRHRENRHLSALELSHGLFSLFECVLWEWASIMSESAPLLGWADASFPLKKKPANCSTNKTVSSLLMTRINNRCNQWCNISSPVRLGWERKTQISRTNTQQWSRCECLFAVFKSFHVSFRFFLMYLINKDETEHTGQVSRPAAGRVPLITFECD